MANEITSGFTLNVTKGSLTFSRNMSKQITLSASSPNVAGGTQSIPTTAGGEAVGLGDVATNGVAYFVNLDSTNYIEIGVNVAATFYPLIRLNAGEGFPMRLAQGIAPYARANTAAVVLEYHIFDN